MNNKKISDYETLLLLKSNASSKAREEAQVALWKKYQNLLTKLYRKVANRIEYDDFIQNCYFEFLRAIEYWNPEKATSNYSDNIFYPTLYAIVSRYIDKLYRSKKLNAIEELPQEEEVIDHFGSNFLSVEEEAALSSIHRQIQEKGYWNLYVDRQSYSLMHLRRSENFSYGKEVYWQWKEILSIVKKEGGIII